MSESQTNEDDQIDRGEAVAVAIEAMIRSMIAMYAPNQKRISDCAKQRDEAKRILIEAINGQL
jgi:hypothetical protein